MVKVATNRVMDGLMPAEKIAHIQVFGGGIEEVSVSVNDISPDNRLIAFMIGKEGDRVLVELPRESASGKWRLWVSATAVGAA